LTLKIRPMTGGDMAKITEILEATPEFTREEVAVALELIDIYLERGTGSGYHILTAALDYEPAGYVCYGPTPMTAGTWDIYWIAVDGTKQRRGIGRALLTAAEEKVKKASGRMVLIETSSKDSYEKTRAFYRDREYGVIARIPDFYSPGDDKLVLRKIFEG
jgi:ribosomal protein S18 acetylase RimI-like enzyme